MSFDCDGSGQSYFAYGSNLGASFLEERLKDGEWLPDGWHKTGQMEGPAPVDHGTYRLENFHRSISIAPCEYAKR